MKRIFFFASLLWIPAAYSQTDTAGTYYSRLFTTCKVWGFVKYFHPRVADCSVNYDSVLLSRLPGIKNALTTSAFNDSLLAMVDAAGTIPMPVTPPSQPPAGLSINLDISWFANPGVSDTVKARLDTIYSRFRPGPHCLVTSTAGAGNPDFSNEINYNAGSVANESYRMLALFRYWNFVRYFYPYTNLMDQDWDTTLTEFIPRFTAWTTKLNYDLLCIELTTRLNDAHAQSYSTLSDNFFGTRYPKFHAAQVQGETVITCRDPSISSIKPGDIIRKINGTDIGILRDSLEKYVSCSNPASGNVYLNDYLLRGPSGSFQLEVEDSAGINIVTLYRNSGVTYYTTYVNTRPVWKDTIVNGNCRFAIINMGRLQVSDIPPMGTGFWTADGLIFDLRNYPNGTLWSLASCLYPAPVHIARITKPDINFPGTLGIMDQYIGGGGSGYNGKVIILVNEQTLSQAEYTCMGLELFPGAVKIGSQTSGADGNVSPFTIPGGIHTQFTGLGILYGDSTQTQRTGIIPDINVSPTIMGLRHQRDEVLESALDCMLLSAGPEIQKPRGMDIYPNPAIDELTVEIHNLQENTVLTIFNPEGQALIMTRITREKTSINTSYLKRGIYIVRITNRNSAVAMKLVKA